MVGVNVFAADEHERAVEQRIVSQRSRARSLIAHGAGRDLDDARIDAFLASPNGRHLTNMTRCTAVGTPAEVRDHLREFAASTGADELIVAHHATRVEDRLRSVELTAAAMAGTD
jgi:putative transposase